MKKLIIWVAVMAALSGCNTISGVGQDISGSANRVAGWMGG
jgi:predicted small secreted protein